MEKHKVKSDSAAFRLVRSFGCIIGWSEEIMTYSCLAAKVSDNGPH